MIRRLAHILVAALLAFGGAAVLTGPAQAASCVGANSVSLKTPPNMSSPDGTYRVQISNCAAKDLYEAYPISSKAASKTIGKYGIPGKSISVVVTLGNKLSQSELKSESNNFTQGIECTMSGAGWVSGCTAQ